MTQVAQNGLAIYDKMVFAIDECYRVDEVKDLRDQAMALEHYARQAMNVEAERKAIEVRIRAERRAGLLLKEMERSPIASNPSLVKAVHADPPRSEFQEAKREARISDTQAKRWQRLAEIPHTDFERKLHDPLVKPSTTGLISGRNDRQSPDDSLWLWGRLRDFEREGYFEKDINQIYSQMSDALQSDTRRLAPQLIDWLSSLEEI